HDGDISGINKFVVELEGFPGGKPLSPLPHGRLSPADPTEVQRRGLGNIQLDFRVPDPCHLGDGGFLIEWRTCTSSQRLDLLAPHLHVLLRHRLLRKPGAASRAWSRVAYSRPRAILPSLIVNTTPKM